MTCLHICCTRHVHFLLFYGGDQFCSFLPSNMQLTFYKTSHILILCSHDKISISHAHRLLWLLLHKTVSSQCVKKLPFRDDRETIKTTFMSMMSSCTPALFFLTSFTIVNHGGEWRSSFHSGNDKKNHFASLNFGMNLSQHDLKEGKLSLQIV